MDKSTGSSPLVEHVRKLVIKRPADITLKSLAETVGVTPVWLSGFCRREFNNPSARTLEKLYVVLTGKQIIND